MVCSLHPRATALACMYRRRGAYSLFTRVLQKKPKKKLSITGRYVVYVLLLVSMTWVLSQLGFKIGHARHHRRAERRRERGRQ